MDRALFETVRLAISTGYGSTEFNVHGRPTVSVFAVEPRGDVLFGAQHGWHSVVEPRDGLGGGDGDDGACHEWGAAAQGDPPLIHLVPIGPFTSSIIGSSVHSFVHSSHELYEPPPPPLVGSA